jgi:DNA-binding CsgD family transcriptional regulator
MDARYKQYVNFLQSAKRYNGSVQNNAAAALINPQGAASSIFQNPLQTAYLLDFSQRRYLAMSPSIQTMLGYSAQYVMDGGVDLVMHRYHPHDGAIYFGDIFMRNLQFLRNRPVEDHPNIYFSYNYRFRNKAGDYRTILQRHVMIQSAPDGTPMLMLAFLTDITHFKNNAGIIHTIEQGDAWHPKTHYKHIYLPEDDTQVLSRREIEVLKHIADGLSSQQIADTLYVSIHTVNNHRKNILQKTASKNVAELLRYATTAGLL